MIRPIADGVQDVAPRRRSWTSLVAKSAYRVFQLAEHILHYSSRHWQFPYSGVFDTVDVGCCFVADQLGQETSGACRDAGLGDVSPVIKRHQRVLWGTAGQSSEGWA